MTAPANTTRDFAAELQAPFSMYDIEWRVQQAGISNNGEPYALVLAYVTNRAIQQRLDDVFSPFKWQNEFKQSGNAIECGIGISTKQGWVWKWDAAEETHIEAVKGGRSGSMKRAAVQWGIGRYLYNLPTTFAQCFRDKQGLHNQKFQATEWNAQTRKRVPVGNPIYGSWTPPVLPDWALPENERKNSSV